MIENADSIPVVDTTKIFIMKILELLVDNFFSLFCGIGFRRDNQYSNMSNGNKSICLCSYIHCVPRAPVREV